MATWLQHDFYMTGKKLFLVTVSLRYPTQIAPVKTERTTKLTYRYIEYLSKNIDTSLYFLTLSF